MTTPERERWGSKGPCPARWPGRGRRFSNGLVAAPAAGTTAAATGAGALLARTCLVDREGPAFLVLAVQPGDRRLGLLVVAHFNEAEAFRAAGLAVHDDLGRLNRAVRRKHRLQIAVGHTIRKVA